MPRDPIDLEEIRRSKADDDYYLDWDEGEGVTRDGRQARRRVIGFVCVVVVFILIAIGMVFAEQSTPPARAFRCERRLSIAV